MLKDFRDIKTKFAGFLDPEIWVCRDGEEEKNRNVKAGHGRESNGGDNEEKKDDSELLTIFKKKKIYLLY